MRSSVWLSTALVTGLLAGGCSDDTVWMPDARKPEARAPDRPPADLAAREATPGHDATIDAVSCPGYTENVSSCTPASTDYQPRKGVAGANGWPACISDDNTYHLIGGMPSSVARSKAFESMAGKLWNKGSAPSSADFLSARDDYSVAEGLASRVARRQDITYPEVPGGDKFACQAAGIPDQYPDRCAGPAKLKPLIDDAFVQGIAGTQPLVQAARIEAALLWFFYLSLPSEVWTCSFNNKNDCDSAIAYYTQVTARNAPAGLATYVSRLGPETHSRIYDAFLAVRCWRDVDQALPATNTALYNLAQAQLDKAARRGLALILRERIGKIPCANGEAQQALIAFVKILGGLIDHAAGLVDATEAAKLKAYTAAPTATGNAVAAAQASLDKLFVCP